jgi:hypothetical protein
MEIAATEKQRLLIDKRQYVNNNVVVQAVPDFSAGSDSYTFPSTGEWPETRTGGRVHVSQNEAPVHA